MNHPTMQDIADELSVSRITVWKALSNRPGVSEGLRSRVILKAQEMGYSRPEGVPETAETDSHLRTQTVSAVVSRPESSRFWMQIIHTLAMELSDHHVNLMYTYLPTDYIAGTPLPEVLSGQDVGGFIVLNVYNETYLRMLSDLPLPKVFLDTNPNVPALSLSGDVLFIEGKFRIQEITERLIAKGCRKIGFIGDIGYAQTNTDRYLGYVEAMREARLNIDPQYVFTSPLGLYTHAEQIEQFLSSLPAYPDAFVCVSDFIAHYVIDFFDKQQVAESMRPILTGFDNSLEYASTAGRITTVDVDTTSVGTRLAQSILYRMSHPRASREISFIENESVFRGRLNSQSSSI